jgi:hypothetical protein
VIIQVLVNAVDPIALAGYVLAGVLLRRLWIALLAGLAWGACATAITVCLRWNFPALWPGGEEIVGRLVGAIAMTAIWFGIATAIRGGFARA